MRTAAYVFLYRTVTIVKEVVWGGGLSKRLEAPGQASACVVKKDEVEKPSGGLVLAVTPAH